MLTHKNVTVPAITDKQLEDDRLVEVNWDGKVVWDWLASDHVDELGFSAEARRRFVPIPTGARSGRAPTGCTSTPPRTSVRTSGTTPATAASIPTTS